jgi:methyltransferase (TIGR00027 family)
MPASKTAEYVALYRALETTEFRRAPLFRDPFAVRFLSRGLRVAARAATLPGVRPLLERYADARAPGARTSAIARTAFLDDAVRAALRSGTRQLVLLGAGFDCRAHRLDELADAAVFEVDRADTQARKRVLAPKTERALRYVAVDFLRDDLGDALVGAGWDAAARTMLVWEGVTNYLTEAAVRAVLAWIGRACAAGSTVAFTYIHAGVLRGDTGFDGGDTLRANVAKLGEPWTFGIDPAELPAFVAACGLALREDIGADDYRRRYLGHIARGYGFYRIAVADVF